jgi:hypothetical protein
MSAVSCPRCSRLVTLPECDDEGIWVRCPLCRNEYSLREAIYALPPVLEIVASPMAASPTKVRPPELPPLATSFQTDTKQEVIEEKLEETPRASESFTRPMVEAKSPDLQRPSSLRAGMPARTPDPLRPPALPGPNPQRPASVLPPTSRPAKAAAPSEVAASAEEPWMSEAIGGNLPDRTRRRRRSSPLREFLKIAIGGLAGLILGNSVLFWGFKVDLFKMAKHLPAFMVPEQLLPKEEPTIRIGSDESVLAAAAGELLKLPARSI